MLRDSIGHFVGRSVSFVFEHSELARFVKVKILKYNIQNFFIPRAIPMAIPMAIMKGVNIDFDFVARVKISYTSFITAHL